MAEVLMSEQIPEKKDCIIQVNCLKAFGRNFSDSYIDWNLPKHQRVLLQILKAHGGKMHINDFMREWEKVPMENKV